MNAGFILDAIRAKYPDAAIVPELSIEDEWMDPHDLDVMAPHGCGLWKVDDSGRITVVKNAIVSKTPDPLPQAVVQRIAYRAASTCLPERAAVAAELEGQGTMFGGGDGT